MKNNKSHVIKVQEYKEEQIHKQGLTEQYNKENQKAMDGGALVLLEEEEQINYKDAVHYLNPFSVLSPSSASTSLKMVANIACPNVHSKLSLNIVWELDQMCTTLFFMSSSDGDHANAL